MAVMMLVVPGELVDIGRSLGNENEEGVSESATLQVRGGFFASSLFLWCAGM